MTTRKIRYTKPLTVVVSVSMLIVLLCLTLVSQSAHASSVGDFKPGRIIDDEIFYDKDAMGSAQDVQRFIENHTPDCDTWGTKPSGYGNLTRSQYATQIKGWQGPPYVCLQNYHENPDTGETSFEKGGGAFAGGINSGQIIWDAAQKHSINPQVLLVLLRKESAGPLFADAWPVKSQYRYAMGYGCPDSGPNYSANCQDSQAGFYKQVEKAAWQLRKYRNEISNYNYQPGRTNRILYNPNPSCGTTDVYIENYATASLYIYTPYVPNNAALNAYPGEAHCGAYGNRNFWFMFKEWFGSTIVNNNFLRSANDATVYLVADGVKYTVADGRLLSAASPLGGVGYVSQSYLNSIPSGGTLGRIIRSPDGTVFFYDAGIKLAFGSCAAVADYGFNCGDSKLLTQAQINRLTRGPWVTNGFATTNGKRFFIKDGERREVYDSQALVENGLSTTHNTLTESAIDYLPYGIPVTREASVVKSRQNSNEVFLSDKGKLTKVKNDGVADRIIGGISPKTLDAASIAKNRNSGVEIGSLIRGETGSSYLLTKDGKKIIRNIGDLPGAESVLSNATISKIPGSGMLTSPVLIKKQSNGTVYAVIGQEKRPLVSMDDLLSITGESSQYIAVASDAYVDSVRTGSVAHGAGILIKTPNSATVYMTDGVKIAIALSSFTPASDMGVRMNIRTVSESVLANYTIDRNERLQPYVSCGGVNYLGVAGELYRIDLANKTAKALDSMTCNVLKKHGEPPRFMLGPDGTIFERVGTTLHPISSMNKFNQLKQSADSMVSVSSLTVGQFDIGSIK